GRSPVRCRRPPARQAPPPAGAQKGARDAAPRASPRTVRRTTHTLFAPVSRLGGDVRGRAPGTGDAVAPSRRSTREIVVTTMSDASLMQADLTELRRSLHRRPEIGLDLPQTQRAVLAALEGLPLEITLGSSSTSVTAVLRGGRPGPAVLLRGDMDALPVTEATGLEYASEIEGVMHACGHDLHVAMLVGAARLLCARRETLQGDVVFMFQPGEEGYDGA